jgi:hypothetical protein
MELTGVIIAALTGSGGLVALIAVILQHRQKMAELSTANVKAETKLEQMKAKQIPLEHHPLFSSLDEIEYFFLWVFELPDHGRTIVVRELCINKLRVWREVIRNHVDSATMCYESCGSKDRLACNKTENDFRKMLLEGLEKYTILWDVVAKNDVYGRLQYDKDSFEVMAKFVPIFQDWHRSREEMVRLAAHEIPNSSMNNDCYRDWWDMLTVYMYAFTQMKYDAVNAMRSLNGEITGESMLGVTIGDIR